MASLKSWKYFALFIYAHALDISLQLSSHYFFPCKLQPRGLWLTTNLECVKSPWSFTVFIWLLNLPQLHPLLKTLQHLGLTCLSPPVLYQASCRGDCCPGLPASLQPLPFAAANTVCDPLWHPWLVPSPLSSKQSGQEERMSAKWSCTRSLNLTELISTARTQGQ